MIRFSAAIALAAVCRDHLTRRGPARVEAGILECSGTTASFILGSVTELHCMFRPAAAPAGPIHRNDPACRRRRRAAGECRMAGRCSRRPAALGPAICAGSYGGAAASATAGVGVGANALVGGSNNTIALQPVSLQGQTGLGVAAGIAGLELAAGAADLRSVMAPPL